MEILREEDERRASNTTAAATKATATATTAIPSSSSVHSQLGNVDSTLRKNSSNFGVRSHINNNNSSRGKNDNDDSLLLGDSTDNVGRNNRARRRNFFHGIWLRIQNLFAVTLGPCVQPCVKLIKWQFILTIACAILCTGIVVLGIGLTYHEHQVLFPKDHEIQYLSVADWRLNRRFRALRAIGTVLLAAGVCTALVAMKILLLSKWHEKRQRRRRQLQQEQQSLGGGDDAGVGAGFGGSGGETDDPSGAAERRFLITPSPYQPIDARTTSGSSSSKQSGVSDYSSSPNLFSGVAGTTGSKLAPFATSSNVASDRRVSLQPIASSSSSTTTKQLQAHQPTKTSRSMSTTLTKPPQVLQQQQQLVANQALLPQFPTGTVKVEVVQSSSNS